MLADLFQLNDALDQWSDGDLGAILRHQLATPLELDLGAHGFTAVKQQLAKNPIDDAIPATFCELLFHQNPPVELLELTKQFAKEQGQVTDGGLPAEVAAVIYISAICAARLRSGERITKWNDETLRKKISWATSIRWLDDQTRSLLLKSAGHIQN